MLLTKPIIVDLKYYAHNCSAKTLIKLREAYAKIIIWQIRKARLHAKQSGPGNITETKKHSRIRIGTSKLDHFIAFANRLHFYMEHKSLNSILHKR